MVCVGMQARISRRVFPTGGHAQVLVFGAGGAGKSELLQALAGARLPPAAVAAGEGLTALAQVERERDRACPPGGFVSVRGRV